MVSPTLGISYKRGRSYIHSPDPYYQQKMDRIALCLLKAWYEPDKYVFLYQDEFTYYRQPTVDRDYEQMGKFQPLARRSYNSDTTFRGAGALNAITGQVTYHQSANFNPLPIKILQLPTYASWANPIEKLWRWVRQTVIHLHRLSDDWSTLKQRIWDFILPFKRGSDELLRYVGLLPD